MLLPHVSRMAQKSEGQILRFGDILEIVSSRRLLRGSLVVGRRGSLTLCRCLSRRSLTLSSEYGLYRQDYCGCIFSKQERERQEAARRKEAEA